MTVVAFVPAIVMLVGAAAYILATNPKVSEMGRIAFAVGLLVLLYSMAGHVVRIG